MKLDLQGKIAIILSGYIGIIVLWAIFFYLPKSNQRKQISNEIKLFKQRSQNISNLSSKLESQEDRLLLTRFEKFLNELPNTDELSQTLEGLKELSKSNNIRILSVDFKSFKENEQNKSRQIEEIPINMIVQGDFSNITDYLLSITELPFFGGFTYIQMRTNEELRPEIQVKFMYIIMTKV